MFNLTPVCIVVSFINLTLKREFLFLAIGLPAVSIIVL